MTGRWDSTGKLEAAMIKKINEMFSLRYLLYFNIISFQDLMHIT